MTDNRTTELREKLDALGIVHFDYDKGGRTQTQWEAPDGKRHFTYETSDNPAKTARLVIAWHPTPEQAIAATLGDDDYECRMDELLCRLTNGKWSKSRSYSVDFMVSCVDEAYEDAALGEKRTCETCDELGNVDSFINHLIQAERYELTCTVVSSYYYDDYDQYEFEFSCGHSVSMYDKEPPNYCPNCGRKVVER